MQRTIPRHDLQIGSYLNKFGITELIKKILKDGYIRVAVHILYSFLSNGSNMAVSKLFT